MATPNLYRHHFQTAYVVRNLDAAMAHYRDRMGVTKWHVAPMAPGLPITRIGMAWVGNIMIELIEADPAMPSIYQSWLPTTEHGSRFHHLGFLLPERADYDAAVNQFNAEGYADAQSGNAYDLLLFHYADTTADHGHYFELVHLLPAGKDFFAPVPHN